VDRETAKSSISTGMVTGGIAAAIYALCFVAAIFYIAS